MMEKFWQVFKRNLRMISFLAFFIYAAIMIWQVYIGPYRSYADVRRYNLQPFKTIADYFLSNNEYNFETLFINLVGNIVTFIPLGFFVPLLFKKDIKLKSMFFLSIVLIFMLEVFQYLLNVGIFDVDDVILNTLGCMIGFWCYNFLVKKK